MPENPVIAAAPLLTPASATRRTGNQWVVNVQGIQVAIVENKSKALTVLCKEAIARNETLVVTVSDYKVRSFVSISRRGDITAAAAPAPGTVKPDLADLRARRDLGTSENSDNSTREWVEETLLGDAPAPAPKRRFGLGRRK